MLRAERAAERPGDARLATEIMLDLLTVVAVRERLAGEGRLLSVEAALEGPVLRDDEVLRCRLLTALDAMADVASEYEHAIGLLGEALTMCRRSSPASDEVARVEMALGRVMGEQNRLDESRMHLLEALSIRRRLFGDNHPATADIQVNLGNTYYREGHLEEARRYYLEPRRPRSARAKTLARKALAAFVAAGATTERDKVSAYLARAGR